MMLIGIEPLIKDIRKITKSSIEVYGDKVM